MTLFSNLFAKSTTNNYQVEKQSGARDLGDNLSKDQNKMNVDNGKNNENSEMLTRQTTNESENMEHIDLFANVRDVPVAPWHINGRNKYANDDEYRRLVDEARSVMFSGII